MNALNIKEAVETINRVENAMIAEMSDAEYGAYMSIPEDDRKAMLFEAYKTANA